MPNQLHRTVVADQMSPTRRDRLLLDSGLTILSDHGDYDRSNRRNVRET
jgi:hypothetical protein